MKKQIIIIALLCLSLLLTGCGITELFPSLALPEGPQQSAPQHKPAAAEPEAPENENLLVIWYTVENDFSDLLESLTERFNAQGDIRAELRAFETEDELARALNYSRPDLLLCSSTIGLGLWRNGNLLSLDTDTEFLSALCSQSDSIGKGYFPFGVSANVLLVNTALAKELTGGEIPAGLFSSLESIAGLAFDFPRDDGTLLFCAQDYSALFSAYMTAAGDEFTGLREKDLQSACYRALYNYLADAAYSGALRADTGSAVTAVISGRAVCGVVSTLDLPAEDTGCTVLPLPDFSGIKPCSTGIADGLAVCCENPSRVHAVSEYLNYIFSIDSSAETEALGRVPAGAFSGNTFNRIMGRENIRLLIPSTENELTLSVFDSWLRRMLSLLY